MDDRPASQPLAVGALLLLLTSAVMPWWGVRYGVQDAGGRWDRVSLFATHDLTGWATVLTGIFVVAAVALVFVRVAGQSWKYEARVYRRDMRIAMGLTGAALLSVLLWPDAYPSVWGSIAYEWNGTVFTEDARPILGWWVALLGGFLLAVGSYLDHRDAPSLYPKGQ